ncbi:MAG: diheme cytochrome c [Nitrosomonadales bacterium]|nr:diheme cytochrome c [Nitrosomonadales bacterium]
MKWLVALTLLAVASSAQADGGRLTVPDNAKWKEECGSCHIAFPPKLLTADGWQKMMSGLDKHFGTNAELDAGDNREILDFLKRHAGSGSRHAAPSLRISDTPWFRREHREVSAQAWRDPAVKSPANCAACHVNAERGDWSERGIRMPKGLRAEGGDDDDD